MISHKYKCILIHIPKTAGTSIENVIWPDVEARTENDLWMGFIDKYHNKYQTGGLQHLTCSQIKEEIGEELYNSYFKFAVVRNPWDKAVSQYLYMIEKQKYLRKFIGMNKWTSFKKYLQLIKKKKHVQWMKQKEFLFDSDGSLGVDVIIRFEDLTTQFESIATQLGLTEIQLPHANKSKKDRMHYSSYYDQETINMISEMYQEDIDQFDYQFEKVK